MLQRAPESLLAENESQVLRVMFALTSMPVGGAETLLVNLVRRMDRSSFAPEICCLKDAGPLGEMMAKEVPVHTHLIRSKWDGLVVLRLAKLFRDQQIDALVTVGAGDKMFWGRLAARAARVPAVFSALHSTGWPDGVGRLNRWLTPITDGYIAVAEEHGRFLQVHHGFPEDKVFVIPNGVDTDRFVPDPTARLRLRTELAIADSAPVCGIVAALRPEKNHKLFVNAAARVLQQIPDAHFVIVGEGPCRSEIEALIQRLKIESSVSLVGNRSNVQDIVAGFDLFSLTSDNEANPVSILEALSCQVPVVASNVGSVSATVRDGETGILVEAGDESGFASAWCRLLRDTDLREAFGATGRALVTNTWSLDNMVQGYERLIKRFCDRPTR